MHKIFCNSKNHFINCFKKSSKVRNSFIENRKYFLCVCMYIYVYVCVCVCVCVCEVNAHHITGVTDTY